MRSVAVVGGSLRELPRIMERLAARGLHAGWLVPAKVFPSFDDAPFDLGGVYVLPDADQAHCAFARRWAQEAGVPIFEDLRSMETFGMAAPPAVTPSGAWGQTEDQRWEWLDICIHETAYHLGRTLGIGLGVAALAKVNEAMS